MNFNDIVKMGASAMGTYASNLPGTSAAPVSPSYSERGYSASSIGAGAGIGLGALIGGYIIGRWFGVVPKII